jgi:hypothetical protein
VGRASRPERRAASRVRAGTVPILRHRLVSSDLPDARCVQRDGKPDHTQVGRSPESISIGSDAAPGSLASCANASRKLIGTHAFGFLAEQPLTEDVQLMTE